MIRSDGRVVALDQDGQVAWVEIADRSPACGNCSSAGSCHADPLGGAGSGRRYRVANSIGAVVGDAVNLAVPEGTVLSASWFSYLLPALLAIGGAVIGNHVGGDRPAIAGTVVGLMIGFSYLRFRGGPSKASSAALSLQRPCAASSFRPESS